MKKILFSISFLSTLWAQPGGYIDQDSIIQLLPEYKAATSIINKRGVALSDSMTLLMSFQEQISFDYIDCQEATKKLNPPNDSTQLEECTKKYELALSKYQKQVEDFRISAEASYTRLSEDLLESIYKVLQEKINAFCSSRKINFLSDKSRLLYCPHCKDYTEDFIKYLSGK